MIQLLLVLSPFIVYYVMVYVLKLDENSSALFTMFTISIIAYLIMGIASVVQLHDSGGGVFAVIAYVLSGSLYGVLAAVINFIKSLIDYHGDAKEHKHIIKGIKIRLDEHRTKLKAYKD